jgi:hypothetical protein
MRNVPQFYSKNDQRVDAFEHADLFPATKAGNLLREAERIMHAEHESNGYDDRGTCVLGAGIEVWVVKPGARVARPEVLIRQVAQGNVSSHAAAKPAIEFLREQGINARWNDGRMD